MATSEQKLAMAAKYKDEGNALVAQKEYKKACAKYRRVFGCIGGMAKQTSQAMAQFQAAGGPEPAEADKLKARELMSVVYSNMALCYIKLADFDEALKAANEAVALNPKNVKALSRQAAALFEFRNYEAAAKALVAAHGLEPGNEAISAQYREVQAAHKAWSDEQEAKKKTAFGGKLL